MVRIAICDDDIGTCKQISELILEYDVKYEIDLKCDTYTSCYDLYEKLISGVEYDLIFLDIEFPKMNGIELGNKIRNVLKNIKTQIIYISVNQDYAMDLFDIQPFNFLVKPIIKEKFSRCVSKFINFYKETNCFFTYTLDNRKNIIAVNEILYFKSCGKKLNILTNNKEISFYGNMSMIYGQGIEKSFIMVKRGLMVNVLHIVHSSFEELKLSNGTMLGISRSCQAHVRERLSFF